ncbi:hypothetical protein, partial [uncultured Gammaproteobacteria bacterium]
HYNEKNIYFYENAILEAIDLCKGFYGF